MKKFLVLLGLLLFGFINPLAEVVNLELNTEYIFEKQTSDYYFRYKVQSFDNMYLIVKSKIGKYHFRDDYRFEICAYYQVEPEDLIVITGHDGCLNPLPPILTYDSTYAIYKYTLSLLNNAKFITFHLTVLRDAVPYIFYIYSETLPKSSNLSIVIILLIIFIPLIIISLAIFLVCRFYCGCRIIFKKQDSANIL